MKKSTFDFSGWATKNDIKCADGRVIRTDAFKHCDGAKVPLVWNHGHSDIENVIGHAILENRAEGVYAYCSLNDTERGRVAKAAIQHGDITALSIFANQLKQVGSDVLHGLIREVSLVIAGANPGAFIESVLEHSDEDGEAAVIYTNEEISLSHSDETEKEDNKVGQTNESEETVEDVYNSMTDKQKTVLHAIVGQVLQDNGITEDEEDDEEEESEGGKEMKHNVFDKETQTSNVLSHSAQMDILSMAKNRGCGTFQNALEAYAADNDLELTHADAVSSGFVATGDGNVTTLFPEYKDVRPGAPELITSDQGWISTVLKKVHKSPISRIRTSQVDIRNIEALRAKGYQKGKKKGQTGNFQLVRRTTDPQTIYVKSALHRDDIVDITDFSYVDYLYQIDKMQLNEELATAIMIGDGRDDGDEGKIYPDKIRPIWTDDELFTLHVDLDLEAAKTELQGTGTGANFGENYIYAEAMINAVLYAREKYKGTGTPDYYCTPHALNVMLLARDMNGRRIYNSKAELASALNVGDIITAEQFEGKTRTTEDMKSKKLLGIIANLADYSLGATKGGEVTHFHQFDIDFNQEKSLLETRCSGALTRVYSAIAIEQDVTEAV